MGTNWKSIKNNPFKKHNFTIKAEILAAIRAFFNKQGFLEVDTPTLVSAPDTSPFVEVFEVKSSASKRLFLTPSPEFFLKKLLAAGFKNIYQITKAYRDQEEQNPLHLREFTMLEWYRTGAGYLDLMADCENLVNFIWKQFQSSKCKVQSYNSPQEFLRNSTGQAKFKIIQNYQNKKLDLTPPWPRISCHEAFEKYANINLDEFLDIKNARKICLKHGYQVSEKNTWEELYHQIFLNEIEPELIKLPVVFLYDYPAPLAALSRIKKDNSRYAERFEFYLAGLEIGNGYSELTDWKEQEKRLKNDLQERKKKAMKVFDYDHDFVGALKAGIPKTAGIAFGIDRLVMFFTDSATIQEVTPFNF